MNFSYWLVYVVAVLVLTVTPGPSVMMCVSTSVNHGPRKALVAALGSTTAIVGIMTLSALGLGAVLAASIDTTAPPAMPADRAARPALREPSWRMA